MSTIEIKHLTFGYDNQGTELFSDAELTLQTEWKLGLIGRNGRGKTTLLNLLQNKLPYAGTIQHQVSFTYFPQAVTDPTQLTYYVLQELTDFEDWKIQRELNLLQLDPEILWREFGTLSGGEQTKVLLVLLFVDEVNFPLIDEPTNHLDVVARKQVADYLKQKRQGFILVSHDRSFVDQVVDHVLSIEKVVWCCTKGTFPFTKNKRACEIAMNKSKTRS